MKSEEYPFDVGQRFHTRVVTTNSDETQRWFDLALCQCYGFNHEEAIRCCTRALLSDENCAMAHWLIAFCTAPNYNKFDLNLPAHVGVDGQEHLDIALRLESEGKTTPVETALIQALPTLLRYDGKHVEGAADDPSSTISQALPLYAEAMRSVYSQFPNDPDVSCVFSQSLMNLRPWCLFTMSPTQDIPAGSPQPGTLELLTVLQKSLATSPNHVGLRHLWIHAVEMGPTPEQGLDPGRPGAKSMFEHELKTICPDAGHLVHMVSHTDVLCGKYQAAIVANADSQRADQKFRKWCAAQDVQLRHLGFYTVYRCHSVHFLVYAAMLCGQQGVATKAATDLLEIVRETRLEEGYDYAGMGFLGGFAPTLLHVYIRFGQWDVILERNVMDDLVASDPDFYRYTDVMLHYARGIAFAVLAGREKDGAKRLELIQDATVEKSALDATQPFPDDAVLMNNPLNAVIGVAKKMLDGELAFRSGPPEHAFALLEEAIQLEESLVYDEPWGWMQPARHALGALMLEQAGRSSPDEAAVLIAKAEQTYRSDLNHPLVRPLSHPDNVWALSGLAECLDRQGKSSERARATLEQVSRQCDVKVGMSCFCRVSDS
eukprot:m.296444 g.296444  ORF g.296444 m.296444 type:complete len:602 (-) comp16274_c0_seq4:1326-3131(-)